MVGAGLYSPHREYHSRIFSVFDAVVLAKGLSILGQGEVGWEGRMKRLTDFLKI